MASAHIRATAADVQVLASSRFGSEAVNRLRDAFERSRHPMLIADDQRRLVTGNAVACDLLGMAREEIPWRTIDDLMPPSQRTTLDQQWQAFLSTGAAEGWYQLHVPERGPLSVEFSAIANVLPARHLSIVMPAYRFSAKSAESDPCREGAWRREVAGVGAQLTLTRREREIMTMVASGVPSGEIAERLFLSAETVKSHVHNALAKLGAHTRAHAVAIALVSGQVAWEL